MRRWQIKHCQRAGPEWLDPHWFRFGASSVLNDLIMQRQAQRAGHYWGADYVSLD